MAFLTPQQPSYLSQHGQVEEPGPKLDLNQSLYSTAHSESEYDQG